MAKFLSNKATQAALEDIINNANKKLILISPYIKLTNTMLARLKSIAEKGVEIKIVYRLNKVDKAELTRLNTIKNVQLKSTNDLHAKCYFNEKEMIITSLNLLDSSEKNWEMGVQISRSNDRELYEAAMNDALTIFNDSIDNNPPIVRIDSQKKSAGNKEDGAKKPTRGYCIRCEVRIPYKIDRPYCLDCFQSWSKYENEDYEEECCHACGEYVETSMAKPVCYKCYKKFV